MNGVRLDGGRGFAGFMAVAALTVTFSSNGAFSQEGMRKTPPVRATTHTLSNASTTRQTTTNRLPTTTCVRSAATAANHVGIGPTTCLSKQKALVAGQNSAPGNIFIPPDTLDGPRGKRIPERILPGERSGGLSNPAGRWLDPSKLPGGGLGPDRERPDVDKPAGTPGWGIQMANQAIYDAQNNASDRSGCFGSWDAATRDKVNHWGKANEGLGVDNPLTRVDSSCHKGGKGDKDTGTTDTGSSDPDKTNKVVDDTSGKPVDKDPDPEGGDPDELISQGQIQDVIAAQEAATGAANQSGTGLPKRTTKGKRGLQPWSSEPLIVRGPRPDENAGATNSAIRSDLLSNANAFPTPDDPDGPTDPRASAGTSLNNNASNTMNGGSTSSPIDGGQGGTPPPSDPR